MNCNHETHPKPQRTTEVDGRKIDWYACIHCGEQFTERNPTVIFAPDNVNSFTFYKWEIAQLIAFIKDVESASFDVDENGYVTVHVAGKDSITL